MQDKEFWLVYLLLSYIVNWPVVRTIDRATDGELSDFWLGSIWLLSPVTLLIEGALLIGWCLGEGATKIGGFLF